MCVPQLGMIFWLAFTNQGIRQVDERPISGSLLLSPDAAIVRKLRNLIRPPFKYFEEFERTFNSQRFIIRKWGSQRLIVVDRQLPMFQEQVEKHSLLLELANAVDENLIVKMSGISKNKGSVLASTIDKLFPPLSRPDGFDISKSAVGIDATVNVTAHFSNDGGLKSVKIPMDPAASSRRNRALDQHLMPPNSRRLTEEEKQAQARLSEDSRNSLEQAPFYAFGTARAELHSGLRESADMIRDLLAGFDLKNKQASDLLLDKLGMMSLSQLARGKVPFDQLPQELRKQFTDTLEGSWKSLGYSSQDEASAAMAGATSFEVSINFGLYRSFRAFDPVTGTPGSGMVYNFVLIRP